MFENVKPFSGFSVDDIAAAQAFYADVLGLRTSQQQGMLFLHVAGGYEILVYPKPNHVPATYTILNFPVLDIEATVDQLAARGVRFERYEGTPMETDPKGIHRRGGPLIAWFTDPAGNVLSVIQQ